MAKIKKVQYLVIHHAASSKTTTIEDIRKWHKDKGWTDIGYHKVIYIDGTVKQGREDSVIGSQAFGANAVSLGICLIGNYDLHKPSEEIIKSLVQVLAILCKRHNLTVDKIIGHCQVAKMFNAPAGASGCPGKYLIALLPEIREKVKKYLLP